MEIRKRRPVISLPVAVLLAAALATAAAAASSAHAASSSPRILPTWAHGSITGAGPHNGVRLALVAWPNGKFRVGQKLHLRVIGTAMSTSNGSYAIHPTVILPKGLHNLEILAHSPKAVGAFNFPRKIVRRGRSLIAVAVNGSAGTGPVTANIRMMALPKSEQSPSRHPSILYCPSVVTKARELGQKLVNVGGLYSELADGTTQETYSAGANTTIGIGVSVSGDIGSFNAAGTFTQTYSGAEPFPALTDDQVHEQTPYAFGQYRVCGLIAQVQPEGWATGENHVHVRAPGINFANCGENIRPHLSFTRKSGTAGTFKAGVDLKKEIGIDLSAQSGYNKQVSIKYTVGKSGGFMCGTNGLPNDASFDVLSPCNATTCVPGLSGTRSVRANRRRTASDTGRVQLGRTGSSR